MNRIMVFLALAWMVSPCTAEKVRIDFDHACDFSHYRTYRWVPSPEGQDLNQLMQQRVIRFIDEALAARHLRRVDTGGDLLISYQTKMTEQDQYTTFNNGYGYGWGWGSGISYTTVTPIYHGTLIVDITDARKQKLVFEGVSTSTLSSKPEKNTKKLAASVRKIFERYPPQ